MLNISILSHNLKLFNITQIKCSSLIHLGRGKVLNVAWLSWPRTWVRAKVWSWGLELGRISHPGAERWRRVRWGQSPQIHAKGALVGLKLCCWVEWKPSSGDRRLQKAWTTHEPGFVWPYPVPASYHAPFLWRALGKETPGTKLINNQYLEVGRKLPVLSGWSVSGTVLGLSHVNT